LLKKEKKGKEDLKPEGKIAFTPAGKEDVLAKKEGRDGRAAPKRYKGEKSAPDGLRKMGLRVKKKGRKPAAKSEPQDKGEKEELRKKKSKHRKGAKLFKKRGGGQERGQNLVLG